MASRLNWGWFAVGLILLSHPPRCARDGRGMCPPFDRHPDGIPNFLLERTTLYSSLTRIHTQFLPAPACGSGRRTQHPQSQRLVYTFSASVTPDGRSGTRQLASHLTAKICARQDRRERVRVILARDICCMRDWTLRVHSMQPGGSVYAAFRLQ